MSAKDFVFCLWLFSLLFIDIKCDRTSLKIYEKIQGNLFCFRRLNATHQIGCSSARNGNIGVVHIVKNAEELKSVAANPPYSPYIMVIPIYLFNMGNMTLIKQSPGMKGVLILYHISESPPEYFSPEQSCPNENFGLYTEQTNPEYAFCKKVQWNQQPQNQNLALGMMYEDWGFPVFLIKEETSIESIKRCFNKFNEPENGKPKPWPLCSAQMKSIMLAAKDSDTCMRRSRLVANLNQVKTCDPLSDKNIVTTLFTTNKTKEVPENSIIVVACRLDAFSMFDRLAPGAHSTVTGLVTLLTVAKAMAEIRDEILEKGHDDRNILFAIFNGEAFDYIGSSRVVYDMQNGVFPVSLDDKINEQPALLDLKHISHFIELSQLSADTQSPLYWIHTDPVSSDNKTTYDETKKLINLLQESVAKEGKVKVQVADSALPLPPASFQSFLRHSIHIPGIVIADHEREFSNRYYNSMFDTNSTINMTIVSRALADLSTALSNTLYELVTDEKPESALNISESLITELLKCYLKNASCDLFREIADPSMTERLLVEPYPLYVSVHTGGPSNAITLYTRYLLAYMTGSRLENRTRQNCAGDPNSQIYQYDWMTGPDENSTGICIKSTVMYTLAESPANILNDWKSTEYSTWTESVWLDTSVRIFLQPSRGQEVATLITGIIVMLLSVAFVYFVNKQASIIFNTKPLISC